MRHAREWSAVIISIVALGLALASYYNTNSVCRKTYNILSQRIEAEAVRIHMVHDDVSELREFLVQLTDVTAPMPDDDVRPASASPQIPIIHRPEGVMTMPSYQEAVR